MNIANLQMFCRVVEEGSVSRAARLSYVSQPAVTRQVRQLENSYGTKLFDRDEGKMKLNKAGELLYPYAKEILALNENTYEIIQEYLGTSQKTLHVGASLTIGEYLLPKLIGKFTKSNPDIKFSVSIGNTPQMIEKLEGNMIDLALVESDFHNDSLQRKKFADDELILVSAYDHEWARKGGIYLHELSKEKMIWREKESGMRQIVKKALMSHNVFEEIENNMELGSMQAIKSAVEADLGISILPKLTVEKELKYKTLCQIPIHNFTLNRAFWLVQKQRRFKGETEISFEQFMINETKGSIG